MDDVNREEFDGTSPEITNKINQNITSKKHPKDTYPKYHQYLDPSTKYMAVNVVLLY